MTARKVSNPDAITRAQAATMLGISEDRVTRYRRDGLLGRLGGSPSYSRAEVQAIVDDPWLTGKQAAHVLGVSHVRVAQLAKVDRIPFQASLKGKRYYRREQLRTVANARRARREGFTIG